MNELSPFPRWLTFIIILAHFALFLGVKAIKKRGKLTFWDLMTGVGEGGASFTFLVIAINFGYLWYIKELRFQPILIVPLDPILWVSTVALITWFWLIYRILKTLGKKR